MSETHANVPFSFEPTRTTWLRLCAAGAILVAAILASVTLGIGWASYETTVSGNGVSMQEGAEFQLFEIEGRQDSAAYTSSELDGADGIGLLRAAGPLAIVGLVLAYLGAVGLAAAAFVRGFRLGLVAAGAASLAAVFLILVVVLFPIGVAQFHEAGTQEANGFTFETTGIGWGAGLIVAILAAVLALVGGVAGWLALRPREAQA